MEKKQNKNEVSVNIVNKNVNKLLNKFRLLFTKIIAFFIFILPTGSGSVNSVSYVPRSFAARHTSSTIHLHLTLGG